ncbi:zinc finger protein 185 isoform X2 [Pungitius pungitius]|uniref:zinc finger protein 185 isoform X2 n=1 Tax=Pungitius pungitius TaxID=134920 RepID=UPI002E1270D9
MSKQAGKESVFLTTKVRTKLKGDGSWLQRRSEAQDKTDEEKPWLAEVRAGRLNGEPVETSPAPSPTTSTPPALKSDADRSVVTKLESSTSSSTSNGVSQTAAQFPKKPSESYKKIAPYTVRPTAESQEAQLSSEEQEKRTEAASSVLMKSTVRQRSYVLSAAKKYESEDKVPETSLANNTPAFVARRVEIVDDESAATPAPVSKPPPSPAAPVPSVASAPEPQPASVADAGVKSAVAEPVALKAVTPVKDDPPPRSVAVKDPSEDKEPGSTKGATPLPVLIPECFQAPKASAISGRVSTPLVDLTPAAPIPASPAPAAPVPSTPVPLTPSPVSAVKTEAKPELVQKQVPKPRVEIVDDESAATPAPVSKPPPSPAAPVPSVASAPEPQPASVADAGVKSAVAEPVALKAVTPVKDDPPPGSVAVKDPSEDKEPGSTKGATPLPVLIPECFQAPKASAISGRVSTPLVDLTPAAPIPASPAPAAPVPSTPVPLTPSPVSAVKTEAKPELAQKQVPKPRADAGVKSAVAEPVALKAVTPVKDDPPPGSVAVKDPSEDKEPGSTKGATPLPVLIPECFQAPKASAISGRVSTPLVDLTPAAPIPASPAPVAPVPSTPVPLTPSPVSAVKTEAKPELVQKQVPKPRADAGVKSAVAEPVALKAVTPVKDDPPPGSVAVKDPSEDKEPGSTKGATPLPVLIPECFQAPKASAISGRVSTPLVDLTPAAPIPASPAPAAPVPSTPVPLTPSPVSAVKTEAKPELVQKQVPKPSSRVDTLTNLSNTLITFNSSSSSFVDDAPVLAGEEAGSANSHTSENGDEEEPAPELGSRQPITDDLLAFTNGPEESRAEPAPPSPGRWSQDLLSGLNSESNPKKTSGPLDFLANDVIPINTEARSLSTQQVEKQADETARGTQSLTETVTITTKTVIITDKSSADPFDPYPIGTTSSNSSSDLLQPDSDISSNSTQRSWARSWQTGPPREADTEESQEALPAARTEDQELLVRFERKSAENDSPWDKWTSPTVYTLPVTTGEEEEEEDEEEEEEEEESTEYTQTQTVTTITTFRERSEEQSVTDRYESYSRSVTEEDRRVLTPEPEARRGFVFLKEYVNATELSSYNARDTPDCGSDYVTSSSTSYSYNSPSTYSSGLPSSSCNFCAEPVGDEAKITIEHLNINCHPHCFKCGVCKKPMGDLLDSMFLHGGKVHCEMCYSEALD